MNQNELKVYMLGHLQFGWGNGRFPNSLTTDLAPKQRAIFCYLLLTGQLHQRKTVSRDFWPDKEHKLGLANLRVALNALRASGLEPYLNTQPQRLHISFNQKANYWCDVQTFEALISRSQRQAQPDIPSLQKAVTLYQGEFLQGFSLPEVPFFDDWVGQQRQRLINMMWEALEALIRWAMEESADFAAGIQYAQRALEITPWREAAHQYLMWFLANSGQQTAALAQYDRCKEVLKSDLDVDPSPETQALVEQIRQHKTVSKPNPQPLPPLLSPEAQEGPPFMASLLDPLFFGRSEPLAQLEEALTAVSEQRRFGIVGMGGIGKTTLAAHLAHSLRHRFPDGVLWGNLVDAQPEEVATDWAAAYGYDLSRQGSGEERLAAVRQLLATKQALLILDDAWLGAKIRHLLPESGSCAVLITSRDAKVVQNVGAIPVPLSQFSAENGRLLLTHYLDEQRLLASPDAVGEICHLLDYLPLAINIAGCYLAYRPHRSLDDFIVQLKQQLKPLDLSEDAQRIRETFELSWKHLDEPQTGLFNLLGLFAGRTFSLEAIATIAQTDIFWVEDRLQTLVQLSLLTETDRQRYRQHGLLAEFAQDKLGDDRVAQTGYVAYFAEFAQKNSKDYEMLRPEWGNLDGVITVATRSQMWTEILKFTAVLKDAWFARGRFEQARVAFETAFQAAVRLEDEPLLAQNWLWWGQACLEQGDQEEARQWLQQALDLYDELDDGIGIANAQFDLARLGIQQSLFEEAEGRLNEVLAQRRADEDAVGTASTLARLARLRQRQHQYDEAKAFALDAVERQTAVKDHLGQCRTTRLLVFIMIALNQPEMALVYAEESLTLAQSVADLGEIAMAKYSLAAAFRKLERLEEANQMAEESYTSLQRMGDHQSMTIVRYLQCLIKRSEEDFVAAQQLAEECLAAFTRLKDELHVAYCLAHLGDFKKIFGEMETAVRLWQKALAIAQKLENSDLVQKINGRLLSNS